MKNIQQKLLFMKAKRKLAGTKVFIDDYLTREEREIYVQMRKVMTE